MAWNKDNSEDAWLAAEEALAQAKRAQVGANSANEAIIELEKVKEANKTKWLPAVATVALRNSTYPNPKNGDTVKVTSDSSIYRFDTVSGWVKTDEYNPTAIDNVTALLAENAKNILFNPQLKTPRMVAHRGFSQLAPENTIPAYELAGQYGFFGAECDVKQTLDGELVLYHDGDLNTKTTGSGTIASKTLAQIKELNFTTGANLERYPNLKIPTIDEFLQACVKYNLYPFIEIANTTDAGNTKLINKLKKYGLINNACIMTSYVPALHSIRAESNVTLVYITIRPVTEDDLILCKTIGNCVMGVSWWSARHLTKSFVELAHSYDVPIDTYTVNNYSDYLALNDWGVDFITTDLITNQGV